MEYSQIKTELLELKKVFFEYGGYLDFTHYLGQADIGLSKENINKLSEFHDYRKKVFMDFFRFFRRICKKIAKRKKLKSGNLDYLTFPEITRLINSRLSSKRFDELQNKRKKHYIYYKVYDKPEKIIMDNFEDEFDKFRKYIIGNSSVNEVKGTPVKKGFVEGRVKIIKQTTSLGKVPQGKIIVTHMTTPDMIPILKKSLAVITDEGGLLCHAAHVAREFEIITVIGTKIATKVLKDGDLVEVDADKGVVKILKN